MSKDTDFDKQEPCPTYPVLSHTDLLEELDFAWVSIHETDQDLFAFDYDDSYYSGHSFNQELEKFNLLAARLLTLTKLYSKLHRKH